MADTKMRVHILAKELGVSSKAIIEKCRAEDVEIPNHMHVLTAGLEATIREWFSEGAHITTLEQSDRVDLTKAKRTRRKRTADQASTEGPAVALEEPPESEGLSESELAPSVAVEEEAPADADFAPIAQPIEAPLEAEPVVIEEPPLSPEAVPTSVPRVAAEAPAAAPSPAQPPPTTAAAAAPVKPQLAAAGPQNIPRPAQLQGPRFVRMDKAEVVAAPRPAARTGPGAGASPPGTGAIRRRGAAGRDRGTEEGEDVAARGAAARARANPRRSIRDLGADVGEKLREWRDRDLLERKERLDQAVGRTHRAVETKQVQQVAFRPAARPERVEITEPVVLKDFCRVTGIGFNQLLPKLMAQGTMATLNTKIDSDLAQLLAMECGIELTVLKAPSPLEKLKLERADLPRKHLASRPPIVTILGHVDHGKTSLLDRIRKTNVAAGEAGGITQHIGAYRVKVDDRYVSFLDTPGHAAFTAMRARGANITDVVVLVVAANDGVMPQTIEAINHARAAKVPIVVALNKIDMPGVDINKIYGQLAEQQLVPQQWGGETDVIHTSATTGQGVDELLTHLAALSELLELKADPAIQASGVVIEAQKTESAGQVARVMVQEGTLKNGAVIVCGPAYGKVRAMKDENGRRLNSAGPATPVEITGLNDLPAAGDHFFELDSLQRAKEIAEETVHQRREAELARLTKPTDLSSMLAAAAGERAPELNVIVKADMQGSVDVLRKTLGELPQEEVKLNILHAGVGAVTDGDVMLAAASKAIVVGFHVVADPTVQRLAEENGVEIRSYRVIYDLEKDIRQALAGLLKPMQKVESRGRAEVREVFNISRAGRVAGCLVRDGVIARNHMVRVLRDNVPIKEGGTLASLKRFKDDAREVRAGLECGLRIEGFDDVKPGDIIEAYEVIEVKREL